MLLELMISEFSKMKFEQLYTRMASIPENEICEFLIFKFFKFAVLE